MFFILQKEDKYNDLDIDILTLKQELNKQRYQHEYTTMNLKDFDDGVKFPDRMNIKNAIPVGSLEFVGAYLKLVHNIKRMNPIEIPNEMRLDKFINRKYSIVEKNELPKSGYFFTKYASELKVFSHTGRIETLQHEDDGKEPFIKDGLYVVSEVVNILSEYRCFILDDEIKGIQYYDGNPTIMPTPEDINKLKEMVLRYSINPARPKAYTLDVAIIKDKGLSILECHPFCSVGLYGLVGSFLPYAYRYGLDWYINHNLELEKYNNFNS